MRNVGLACSLLIAVSSLACAEASDDGPADATPIFDAPTDVPGIEIGNTDTGTAPVDSGTPDTSVADSGADTNVVDSSTVDSGSDTNADSGSAPDTADTAVADTGSTTDTAVADTAVTDTGASDSGTPYRHTITIDGTNDFTASAEKLSTTTSSYDAFVTWDASNLYIAYTGSDVADTTSTTKWLFVYLDVDPGAGTGATSSEQYATQKHNFASGFGAEHYYAWRTDGLFPQQKAYSGGAWSNATATVTANRSGTYVEIKIPFSTFGTTPAKLGVTSFFLNEASSGEWTYAGLYNTSFTDGKSASSAPKTIANYLRVDLTSTAVPNSGANKAS